MGHDLPPWAFTGHCFTFGSLQSSGGVYSRTYGPDVGPTMPASDNYQLLTCGPTKGSFRYISVRGECALFDLPPKDPRRALLEGKGIKLSALQAHELLCAGVSVRASMLLFDAAARHPDLARRDVWRVATIYTGADIACSGLEALGRQYFIIERRKRPIRDEKDDC